MPTFYDAGAFNLFATDVRVQSWPVTQFAKFTVTALAPSGTQIIVVEATSAFDNDRWLLGAHNVLSFAIAKDQLSGALRVDIGDASGSYYPAFGFPLTGHGVVDTLTGFELGGLIARFTFVNGLDAPTNASGWLQVRSW